MSARAVANAPDKQALKADCAGLVRAVGGVEAAGGFCRAGFRRLSEYGRPDNDCFMPVDVVVDLEAVAHGTVGYPQVTRRLAARQGFALVALPAPTSNRGDLHAALARAVEEAGDVTKALLTALADGRVEPEEARNARAECVHAAEEMMRLHALLGDFIDAGTC